MESREPKADPAHPGQSVRFDEAIDCYESAIEVAAEHLPTIQALVSCQLRHGHADERTAAMLRLIALRGDNRWRAWAAEQLYLDAP